jgi:hypothetical protein
MPSKPKTVYHASRDALRYLSHPDAEFLGVAPCLEGITVREYLAKGAFGAVYVVDYQGQECVMKIVVGRNVTQRTPYSKRSQKHYNLHQTAQHEFETEVARLQRVSDLGIGPKLMESRSCVVVLPHYWQEQSVWIGIVLMERLERTLYSLMQEYWAHLENLRAQIGVLSSSTKKRHYNQTYRRYDAHIRAIALSVAQSCAVARAHGLFNNDLHLNNIMLRRTVDNQLLPVISDWGIVSSSYKAQCEKVQENIVRWWTKRAGKSIST